MKKAILLFITCSTIFIGGANAQNKKGIAKPVAKETKKQITKVAPIVENDSLVWTTDIFKADSVSRKTHKPIFGFFTGSDWCGWCHRLEREVFEKEAFKKWAKQNVVLLELDYPRKKQLPPNLQQQNAQLQQAFQVQGYPTIWMFYIEKDGETNNIKLNALGSLGYPRNPIEGKEEIAFLETANEILAKGKAAK